MNSKIWSFGASVLFAALFSTTVLAQPDIKIQNYQFAPDAYKDLPGVKAPEDLAKMPSRYKCETVLLPTRNPDGAYRDVFGSKGLPTTGYRCSTSDGQSYYGTVHPNARNSRSSIDPYSPL